VSGNLIEGYGYANGGGPPNGFSIQATALDSSIIADNVLRNWQGYGIYSAGSSNCKASGNVFGALSGTVSGDACIYLPTEVAPWEVEGNMHRINTGQAAHMGCTVNSGTTITARVNDFASAITAAYGNTAGGTLAVSAFLGAQDPVVTSNGLIVGQGLGATITNKLKGTLAFSATTTGAVSFGVTLPSATYQVTLSAGSTTQFPSWSSKATTGFSINFAANFTGNVDWIVEQ